MKTRFMWISITRIAISSSAFGFLPQSAGLAPPRRTEIMEAVAPWRVWATLDRTIPHVRHEPVVVPLDGLNESSGARSRNEGFGPAASGYWERCAVTEQWRLHDETGFASMSTVSRDCSHTQFCVFMCRVAGGVLAHKIRKS